MYTMMMVISNKKRIKKGRDSMDGQMMMPSRGLCLSSSTAMMLFFLCKIRLALFFLLSPDLEVE
jgi:hypothetical protein